jgi:hypothetical protein
MRPNSDIGEGDRDAMRKVWKEIQGGREWIVDADLKDFRSGGTWQTTHGSWPREQLMAGCSV